jgi:hypothetical protein
VETDDFDFCNWKPGTDGTFSVILLPVARLPRVIAVDVPHHVTQRGNARQFILTSGVEKLVYLDLLRNYARLHQLSLIGYCFSVIWPQKGGRAEKSPDDRNQSKFSFLTAHLERACRKAIL